MVVKASEIPELATINDYELDGSNSKTILSTGQKVMTASALSERIKDLVKLFPDCKVEVWRDRSKDSPQEAVFVTETSGKVKLCSNCNHYLLKWHPKEDELACTDCGTVIKSRATSTGTRASSNNGAGNTQKRTVISLDPSYVALETKNDLLEVLGKTKYEYVQSELMNFFDKLGLELGSKDCKQLLSDTSAYARKYKDAKAKIGKLQEELKPLKTKYVAARDFVIALLDFPPIDKFDTEENRNKYPMEFSHMDRFKLQLEKAQKELEELTKM